MKGFVDDIEEMTEHNSDFRRVLYTGTQLQLVLMSLEACRRHRRGGASRPRPVLSNRDGRGRSLNRWSQDQDPEQLRDHGARRRAAQRDEHRRQAAELYTLYGPPEHADATVHVTKADAMESKEHFAGQTTE